VETAARAGLKAMHSAWAQLVAETMVRATRFDPLHQGTTAQQLRQRLTEWLAGLATRESLDASIESGGTTFTATVRREQFALAAEAWYAQLADLVQGGHRADEPATLALSARAALLPGLAERLGNLPGVDVIVLPDTDAEHAYPIAEWVRKAIEACQSLDGEDVDLSRVTASVGVATYPLHARDAENLFREADAAMYAAKRAGKNRVVVAPLPSAEAAASG